jgi:hypothetical protein
MRKLFIRFLAIMPLVMVVFLSFAPQASAAIALCGDDAAGGIKAPGCGGGSTLEQIVSGAMNIVFFISFIITLFMLVWGGLKWVLAQGEKEGITKAREQVTNSLIGLVVILASYVLLNLALQLVLGKSLQQLSTVTLRGLIP